MIVRERPEKQPRHAHVGTTTDGALVLQTVASRSVLGLPEDAVITSVSIEGAGLRVNYLAPRPEQEFYMTKRGVG